LELESEIDKLEKEKEFLKSEIAKDKEILKKMSNEKELEKLAREKYYMKKDNEEIFLIEYEDSIKQKNDE
jgi:cell division protein FtsB